MVQIYGVNGPHGDPKGSCGDVEGDLTGGSDVNATNKPGKKAAPHVTAMHNKVATIDALVVTGVGFEGRGQVDTTALLHAADYSSLEALTMVVKLVLTPTL